MVSEIVVIIASHNGLMPCGVKLYKSEPVLTHHLYIRHPWWLKYNEYVLVNDLNHVPGKL